MPCTQLLAPQNSLLKTFFESSVISPRPMTCTLAGFIFIVLSRLYSCLYRSLLKWEGLIDVEIESAILQPLHL